MFQGSDDDDDDDDWEEVSKDAQKSVASSSAAVDLIKSDAQQECQQNDSSPQIETSTDKPVIEVQILVFVSCKKKKNVFCCITTKDVLYYISVYRN